MTTICQKKEKEKKTKKTQKPDLSAPALLSDSHSDRPDSQQKLDSVPDTEKPT